MMEFTLARVCLSVCGLLLLAAVIVPVTGMYESHTVNMESDVPDDIARFVDGFWYSEMDDITVPMNEILPNISSHIEFKDHMIILTTDRGTYKSGTKVPVISEDIFGYGDMLRLSKNEGIVTAERSL